GKFVGAVLAHEPTATGPAVMLYEAGNTIVRAFKIAALFALSAIALLLWLSLRSIRDVLVTLIPLLLAAVLTMELCVLFNIPLNFTNIIAFPLLLGVGVAFKIYYIMAWRRGGTALVQSTLTRAVIFSAMTTATAFGSQWLPHQPRAIPAIDNLRSVVILLVVAVHVLLPYFSFLPAKPYAFDRQPWLWRSFPLVDSHRLLGFDLLGAWVDVFVMATFFLL